MKFDFDAVATGGLVPRPVVPVRLDGLEFAVPALIDSGALANRFDARIGSVEEEGDVAVLKSSTRIAIGRRPPVAAVEKAK